MEIGNDRGSTRMWAGQGLDMARATLFCWADVGDVGDSPVFGTKSAEIDWSSSNLRSRAARVIQ
jgi:hypothetical protein